MSTESQAREDKASLAQQEAAIRERAAALGIPLVSMFRDAGASGGTGDRPAFRELLAWCKANPRPASAPGVVLVYDDSRWGRFSEPLEANGRQWELAQSGWAVKFCVNDDTDDESVRPILRAVHQTQARAYREAVRATAARGARGTAEAGYWGGRAPIGYRRREISASGEWGRVLEDGQRKSDLLRVRLVPGPAEEVGLVQWLFESYADAGVGLWTIARQATERWPGKKWSQQVVSQILRNPVYAGKVVWCRRPGDAAERARTPVRASDDWVSTPDAHEAIVNAALFQRVADRLAEHKEKGRGVSSPYLLTGVMSCAHCGERFIGGGRSPGKPAVAGSYSFYLHRHAGKLPHLRPAHVRNCPHATATVNKVRLEAAVIAAITREVGRPEMQRTIAAEFDAMLAEREASRPNARRALTTQRAKLEAKRTRLAAAVADGDVPADAARATFAQLDTQLAELAAETHRARFDERRADTITATRDRVLEAARNLEALASRLPAAKVRELVLCWIESARVDRTAHHLALSIRTLPASPVFGPTIMPGRG